MLPDQLFVRCLAFCCLSSLCANVSPYAIAQSPGSNARTGSAEVREVLPTGWRRTVNGWENAASWRARSQARQLQHWIKVSHQHESPRVIAAMAELRELHPLVYAFSLMAFTWAVFQVSSHRRRTSAIRRRSRQLAETKTSVAQAV